MNLFRQVDRNVWELCRDTSTVWVVPHQTAAISADLVVVGAGIVGLAHAIEAQARGLSVAVIERDACAVGASVRNFGHVGTTVHAGQAGTYAEAARDRWLSLAPKAGFDLC